MTNFEKQIYVKVAEWEVRYWAHRGKEWESAERTQSFIKRLVTQ